MESPKLNTMKILITGGAGFIGTHLSRRLLMEGHYVRVFDNFDFQIHGYNNSLALDLNNKVELIKGDVRDKIAFHKALAEIDTVIHLAAATGTGQSMYDIQHYESVNIQGTTNLIDFVVNHSKNSVIKKIIVASSRAVYGEGSYNCPNHGTINPGSRKINDMKNNNFDLYCSYCKSKMDFIPTQEREHFDPISFYGLTKQFQEQLILMYCKNMSISGYALRFQNVYGPGQSLNNPYTGILAIFSSLARDNKEISIFEDGQESRDFVYIDDVVNATLLCLKNINNDIDVFNVGSNESTSVIKVANEIISYFSSNSIIKITGDFRKGDIRHNLADLTTISSNLGYSPKWDFSTGLKEFLKWAKNQPIPNLEFKKSILEMKKSGQFYTKNFEDV